MLGNHMLLISSVQMLSKDRDEADTAGMISQPQNLAFVIVIFLSTHDKQARNGTNCFLSILQTACYGE